MNSQKYKLEDCLPLPEIEGVEMRHLPGHAGVAIGSDGSLELLNPQFEQ